MKEIQYKDFSLSMHENKLRLDKPSLCHFELTFKCNFKCKYCYVDCRQRHGPDRRELSTEQVKLLLDKVYESGALWLCLTGGEPLIRKDFFEIYDYAKRRGFIISILTNASLLDEEKIAHFKESPPFTFEITLNSIRKNTFERISGVRGSFAKVMRTIKLLSRNKINFFLKSVVIRDNASELTEVKKFSQDLGVRFKPSLQILPRIDGDKTPCSLRVSAQEALELGKKLNIGLNIPELCFDNITSEAAEAEAIQLFPCGGGTRDQICLNPYGDMFFCLSLRDICADALSRAFESCFREFARIRERGFQTQSRCRYCSLRRFCSICPGKAYLETQDMEAPVEWFCALTHLSCGKIMAASMAKADKI